MNSSENLAFSLGELATPALLLDHARLEANCVRMRERIMGLGVQLRPHLKTAKCAEVARLALGKNTGPITVSTLNEAAWFAQRGFHDLLYAVGFNPAKLAQAVQIKQGGAALKLITDLPVVAAALGTEAVAAGCQFAVLIEIDSGQGRGGVPADSEDLLEIGRILHHSAGTELAGVLTHAGHSYDCKSAEQIVTIAEQERSTIVAAADRLRAADLPCPIVSAGSTPTASFARSLRGITEMRPGVYQFGDLAQVCLGTCTIEDIAISVLATVIGHNRQRGRILVDAGGLALSKDKSASQYRRDWEYGLLCNIDGELLNPPVSVCELEQEHGFIEAPRGSGLFARLPVGRRVRILPNHACMTAAAFNGYRVIDDSAPGRWQSWPRCNGWGE
jgi:D-serine deaminase-like pyridoxal phosphate-dependent protein